MSPNYQGGTDRRLGMAGSVPVWGILTLDYVTDTYSFSIALAFQTGYNRLDCGFIQ